MAKNQKTYWQISATSKVGTWVRGILLIISLVNMALSAAGKLRFLRTTTRFTPSSASCSRCSSAYRLIGKNNSFTEAAQTADKFLHEQGSAIEDPGTDEEAE